MSILTREFFLALYKKINLDKNYNTEGCSTTIPWIIKKSNAYDSLVTRKILEQFDKEGFILIEFESNSSYKDALEWAANIIGTPVSDSSNYGKNYSKIIAEKDAKYFANTNYTQPLHTDDAHVSNTPRIISLFCEKQAEKGGITTLVKFADVSPKLFIENSMLLKELYNESALILEGANGFLRRPFFYNLENSSNGIVYPAFLLSLEADEKVIGVFRQLTDLIHQKENQIRLKLRPGQLLVIDNFKMLHGRTKFKLSEKRVLYRFCFEIKRVI